MCWMPYCGCWQTWLTVTSLALRSRQDLTTHETASGQGQGSKKRIGYRHTRSLLSAESNQNNVREIVWVGLIKLLSFSEPEYYVSSNILIYSGHPYILVRIWARPVGKKVRFTFL